VAAREAKPTIDFGEFQRLDLRLGTVLSAERVKKKDKLLDLRVDTGDVAPRRIIAGLAASYAPDELVGKQVVVLTNLAPRDFGKGLVSEGMILAADGGERLRALMLDPPERPGTVVR
jgi:methionyl-tRNA synthetase